MKKGNESEWNGIVVNIVPLVRCERSGDFEEEDEELQTVIRTMVGVNAQKNNKVNLFAYLRPCSPQICTIGERVS